MSSPSLVATTLRLTRDAEHALTSFPPGTPDHETARLLVIELRGLYGELIDATSGSEMKVRASIRTIERAQMLLRGLTADPASN